MVTYVIRRPLIAAAIAMACVFGAGCSDSPPGNEYLDSGVDFQADTIQPDIEGHYRLRIVGWDTIELQYNQQVRLQVRYTRNEESAVGEPITFRFKPGDNAGGSSLSTPTAVTDNLGFAETTLTAGTTEATFHVQAEAPSGDPVEWTVTVKKTPTHQPDIAKLKGTFTVTSNFDIQGDFTGSTMADVLNFLEEISDDPDDPGQFIVDQIINPSNIGQSTYNIVKYFVPALYPVVNDLLTDLVGNQIIDGITTVSGDLSDLARRFQIKSSIISTTEQEGDQPMTVKHRLDTMAWTLKGNTDEYTFAQLGMSNPEVDDVTLTLDLNNKIDLTVSQHSFDLNFGAFLLVGLNNLIIPLIEPTANDIGDLFKTWVDCTEVGKTINDEIGILGEAGWKAACDAAMTALGAYVSNEIAKINADTSSLTIQGQCKITDENADGYYDKMAQGLWTGTFSLNQNDAVVAGPENNFTGEKTN